MGEGIGDYTKNMVDLRRHMWMAEWKWNCAASFGKLLWSAIYFCKNS